MLLINQKYCDHCESDQEHVSSESIMAYSADKGEHEIKANLCTDCWQTYTEEMAYAKAS